SDGFHCQYVIMAFISRSSSDPYGPGIETRCPDMFKRTILAAVAISMLAVPMAQAQSRYDGPARHGQYHSQPSKPGKPGYQAQNRLHQAQRPAPHRRQWKQGQRVQNWKKRQHVRDYGGHGL